MTARPTRRVKREANEEKRIRGARALLVALLLIAAAACAAQAAKEDILLARNDSCVFRVSGADLSPCASVALGTTVDFMGVKPDGDAICAEHGGWMNLDGSLHTSNDQCTIYNGNGETTAPTHNGELTRQRGHTTITALGVLRTEGVGR